MAALGKDFLFTASNRRICHWVMLRKVRLQSWWLLLWTSLNPQCKVGFLMSFKSPPFLDTLRDKLPMHCRASGLCYPTAPTSLGEGLLSWCSLRTKPNFVPAHPGLSYPLPAWHTPHPVPNSLRCPAASQYRTWGATAFIPDSSLSHRVKHGLKPQSQTVFSQTVFCLPWVPCRQALKQPSCKPNTQSDTTW